VNQAQASSLVSAVPSRMHSDLAITVHLLASFMVVVPSTDVSTATGNRFLGRYQSGRDDDSPCADKEKYEHSK
jgi:hypothetical protein